MVNIVDITDFSGRFFLSENEYNTQQLQGIINEYTKKMLVDLIGIELYNDFNTDFQDNNGVPIQERWDKFLNGEIYTPANRTIDYKIEYEGIKKHIVPLIYGKLMRDTSYTSDLGFVYGKTDGAEKINLLRNKNKADKAWNEGVAERSSCSLYLYTNREIYTDYELYYVKYESKGTLRKETLI